MYKIADHSSDLLTFFFLTLGMYPIIFFKNVAWSKC